MQRNGVKVLALLNDVQDVRTGQLRKVTETQEAQNCMKDIIASHKSSRFLEYPGRRWH